MYLWSCFLTRVREAKTAKIDGAQGTVLENHGQKQPAAAGNGMETVVKSSCVVRDDWDVGSPPVACRAGST